ncbi:unnamed protein product [Discula destructiva]
MSDPTGPSSEDISHELQAIQASIQALSSNGDTQTQRRALLDSARSLVAALETPAQVIARLSWEVPTASAALRLLIELGVFKLMLAGGGVEKQTASELAGQSGADPVLVQRLLKRVAAASPPLVDEMGPDVYVPNRYTRAFADDVYCGPFIDMYDGYLPACTKITEFFQKENFKNPISKDNTIWQFSTGNTNVPYFTWFAKQSAARQRAFANHMKFKSLHQTWYDAVHPLSVIFPPDFDPDKVLMVDVGGNAGHDLLGFHRAHPEHPGRLILQDLPGQILPLDKEALAPIEPMCHDFFTPQPVKGAKAYYLKMVLHDWPDVECRKILSNLKPALVSGYSRILVNEIVVLDQGADSFSTSVDIIMMVVHSSWERREKQWRELVEGVGLKITRIWPCGGAPEKLIEIELA